MLRAVSVVTFSLALVRGAGPDAIQRLGALLPLIEWPDPFVPLLFWLAVDYPTVSLLLLTLFAELIARELGYNVEFRDLFGRIPVAATPVLWEITGLLLVVRIVLPWCTASVVLLLCVVLMRWGNVFENCCRRRGRARGRAPGANDGKLTDREMAIVEKVSEVVMRAVRTADDAPQEIDN